MNFKHAFSQGKQGRNFGLPTGFPPLDRAIDGIQRKSIYGIAAAPKVGKTTLTDFSFVIEPYLYYLSNSHLDVEWLYFSYEIDRVKKEFDFAAHFMHRDHGVFNFVHKGKTYLLSARYLLGRLKDHEDEMIPVSPEHEVMLNNVYENRIIPLFGKYDDEGNKLSKGRINFFDTRDNPTGIRNAIRGYAEKHGKFIKKPYSFQKDGKTISGTRTAGYKSNNPDKVTIIVIDHLRKMKKERGYQLKQNVDKMIEYCVEDRNLCGFTYALIIHLNRSIADVQRLKLNGDEIYPTGDDVKDTGNLSEECDYLLTMFNAGDQKFSLSTHFGVELANYPNYRSIHLVESRDTECPQHLQCQMFGNIKSFTEL
jgi:hypothetical protein